MNAFEQFITAISGKLIDGNGQPQFGVRPYSAFHLTGIVVTVVVAVLMCVFWKDVRERTMRIILLAAGGLLVLSELYKQVVTSFDGAVWRYDWSAFPFQFCATPMYAILLAGILKGGKLRDGLLAYLSTFSLGAGVCVFLFVGDIYHTPLLGVCVQTTVYHGIMVAVGALLLRWNRRRGATLHQWIWATVAFFGFEAIALSLNLLINGTVGAGTVDLYFLSVTGSADIPVFGILREKLPYFAYLALYNVGFTMGSFCLYSLSLAGRKPAITRRTT